MGGYQRVNEKLRRLCCGPDCTIGAVREVLYKGRAQGRTRWRLALPPRPLINQHAAGNRRLVQPGSTRAPQSRASTWQVDPSSRAACIRPQTSLLPGPILHGCTCRGLFVYPRSTQPPPSSHPSCTQSTSMPNYSPMISKLFDIFPNFIY